MIDINNDLSTGLRFSIQFFTLDFSYKKDPISKNNPKHEQPLLPPKKTMPII